MTSTIRRSCKGRATGLPAGVSRTIQPEGIYTSITGCWQCLPLSVVQLKSKHRQKPHCRNGVVDTFGHSQLTALTKSET